jgi:hypothetical protein
LVTYGIFRDGDAWSVRALGAEPNNPVIAVGFKSLQSAHAWIRQHLADIGGN